MTDVICSGWLSIDSKRRWVLLKDLYIYFYGDQPTEGKNMKGLKGLIYLPHALVKPAPGRTAVFMLSCKDRTHTLSTSASELAGEEAEKYLISWKNTLEYVIERAQVFKTQPTVEGWLHKRGGRGHEFKNTKRRYFVLRGNMLAYYSSVRKSDDDISSLKGFIEVSQISALNSSFSERQVEFSVQTNGGREYILIAKDVGDKVRWIDGIKLAANILAQLQFAVALPIDTEEVIKTGKMSRITNKGTHGYYFALTSSNLRFYSADFGSVPSLVSDFGRHLVACIPLLGANVEHDPAANTLSVLDVTGNSYLFSSKSSNELRKWEEDISLVSKDLARKIIRQRGVIRLNTYILPEQAEQTRSKGYCVITVSPRTILFNFLMLRRDIEVPWRSLRAVDMIGDDIFCLKYKRGGELKQLNIRSRNACGLYDTIEAVQEELTENPQDDTEEEHYASSDKPEKAKVAPPLSTDAPSLARGQADSGTSDDHSRRSSTADSEEAVALYDIDHLPPRSRAPSLAPVPEGPCDVTLLPPAATESSDRTDPSASSSSVVEMAEDAGSDSEDPAIPTLPSAAEFHRALSKKNSGLGTDSSDTAATTEEDSPRVARKQSSQSVDSGDTSKPKKSRLNKKKKKMRPVHKTTSVDALPL